MEAEQERRIDLLIAALRAIDVYTEAELEEARERMVRLATDPIYRRVGDLRVQGGSGP